MTLKEPKVKGNEKLKIQERKNDTIFKTKMVFFAVCVKSVGIFGCSYGNETCQTVLFLQIFGN